MAHHPYRVPMPIPQRPWWDLRVCLWQTISLCLATLVLGLAVAGQAPRESVYRVACSDPDAGAAAP